MIYLVFTGPPTGFGGMRDGAFFCGGIRDKPKIIGGIRDGKLDGMRDEVFNNLFVYMLYLLITLFLSDEMVLVHVINTRLS